MISAGEVLDYKAKALEDWKVEKMLTHVFSHRPYDLDQATIQYLERLTQGIRLKLRNAQYIATRAGGARDGERVRRWAAKRSEWKRKKNEGGINPG